MIIKPEEERIEYGSLIKTLEELSLDMELMEAIGLEDGFEGSLFVSLLKYVRIKHLFDWYRYWSPH